MRTIIDEGYMSFPANVWEKILYKHISEMEVDIFYNDHGHPKHVHDAFGALAINEFRLAVINEICKRNSTDEIWRVTSDGFAILSKDSNCASFTLDFRGIKHTILKKTIKISTCKQQ